MFYYETLNNATREGARYAIVHGDELVRLHRPAREARRRPCDPSGEDVEAARP